MKGSFKLPSAVFLIVTPSLDAFVSCTLEFVRSLGSGCSEWDPTWSSDLSSPI